MSHFVKSVMESAISTGQINSRIVTLSWCELRDLLAIATLDCRLVLYRLSSQVVWDIHTDDIVNTIAWNHSGTCIYIGMRNGRISVVSAEDGRMLALTPAFGEDNDSSIVHLQWISIGTGTASDSVDDPEMLRGMNEVMMMAEDILLSPGDAPLFPELDYAALHKDYEVPESVKLFKSTLTSDFKLCSDKGSGILVASDGDGGVVLYIIGLLPIMKINTQLLTTYMETYRQGNDLMAYSVANDDDDATLPPSLYATRIDIKRILQDLPQLHTFTSYYIVLDKCLRFVMTMMAEVESAGKSLRTKIRETVLTPLTKAYESHGISMDDNELRERLCDLVFDCMPDSVMLDFIGRNFGAKELNRACAAGLGRMLELIILYVMPTLESMSEFGAKMVTFLIASTSTVSLPSVESVQKWVDDVNVFYENVKSQLTQLSSLRIGLVNLFRWMQHIQDICTDMITPGPRKVLDLLEQYDPERVVAVIQDQLMTSSLPTDDVSGELKRLYDNAVLLFRCSMSSYSNVNIKGRSMPIPVIPKIVDSNLLTSPFDRIVLKSGSVRRPLMTSSVSNTGASGTFHAMRPDKSSHFTYCTSNGIVNMTIDARPSSSPYDISTLSVLTSLNAYKSDSVILCRIEHPNNNNVLSILGDDSRQLPVPDVDGMVVAVSVNQTRDIAVILYDDRPGQISKLSNVGNVMTSSSVSHSKAHGQTHIPYTLYMMDLAVDDDDEE